MQSKKKKQQHKFLSLFIPQNLSQHNRLVSMSNSETERTFILRNREDQQSSVRVNKLRCQKEWHMNLYFNISKITIAELTYINILVA